MLHECRLLRFRGDIGDELSWRYPRGPDPQRSGVQRADAGRHCPRGQRRRPGGRPGRPAHKAVLPGDAERGRRRGAGDHRLAPDVEGDDGGGWASRLTPWASPTSSTPTSACRSRRSIRCRTSSRRSTSTSSSCRACGSCSPTMPARARRLCPVCGSASGEPTLHAIENPASLPWHEVTKVQHYWLDTGTIIQLVSTHSDTDQDRRGHDNG